MSEKHDVPSADTVLKALKLCLNGYYDGCLKCPYSCDEWGECRTLLLKDAIAVIEQLRSTSPCGQGGEGQEGE